MDNEAVSRGQVVQGRLAAQVEIAKTDKHAMNTLIHDYLPFIKKCVSGVFFKKELREEYVTEAMLGFLQSVRTYRSESGAFIPYAQTVIRNRLLNSAAKEARVQKFLFKKPPAEDEDNGEHARPEYETARRGYELTVEQENLRLEIAQINAEFSGWDFDVRDLVKHRPKQDRSRLTCRTLAVSALAHPPLIAEMKEARKLPVKKLTALTGCSEKILEKYRRYIIALILIMDGEYPYIQSFLPAMKELCKQEGIP
jgi:RNA polymerase sigma factor